MTLQPGVRLGPYAAGIEVTGTSLQISKIEALFGGLLVGGGFLYDVAPAGRAFLPWSGPKASPKS